ncbi:putative Clavaminate synthase-like protein [Seiridium cardinale]|uniref:Clavaminate synthase-like protein n=1 Tax=Seiridium cardinale TaxID=138064 RepID=A0ABR2XJM1_9PEZI
MLQTLDLSHFISDTQEQRQQFVDALLEAFHDMGFVKLINHGFDAQQLTDLFIWKFFNQSLDAKNETPSTMGPEPPCGYTPTSVEMASKSRPNEKTGVPLKDAEIDPVGGIQEHFDQGAADDVEYPNKWPKRAELAGFRPFMEAFYSKCDAVCLTLVKALETGFGVEDGSLEARCVPSATNLRLTHFPPIAIDEIRSGATNRIAPHSDYGIFTLLFQDSVGGLEVEDHSSPTHPTRQTPSHLQDKPSLAARPLTKAPARSSLVTAPDTMREVKSGSVLPERFSMSYFFKAQRSVSVGPLPKFVRDDKPAKYDDINALEWFKARNNLLYT